MLFFFWEFKIDSIQCNDLQESNYGYVMSKTKILRLNSSKQE